MKRGNLKFCPRCGAQNHMTDRFCIRCRYDFSRRKKTNLGPIIIVLFLLIVGWVALRTFLKLPIIPPELIDIVQNFTSSKAG